MVIIVKVMVNYEENFDNDDTKNGDEEDDAASTSLFRSKKERVPVITNPRFLLTEILCPSLP